MIKSVEYWFLRGSEIRAFELSEWYNNRHLKFMFMIVDSLILHLSPPRIHWADGRWPNTDNILLHRICTNVVHASSCEHRFLVRTEIPGHAPAHHRYLCECVAVFIGSMRMHRQYLCVCACVRLRRYNNCGFELIWFDLPQLFTMFDKFECMFSFIQNDRIMPEAIAHPLEYIFRIWRECVSSICQLPVICMHTYSGVLVFYPNESSVACESQSKLKKTWMFG